MRPANGFPIAGDVDDEHSCADDIGHRATRPFDRAGDVGKRLTRLSARITDADDLA